MRESTGGGSILQSRNNFVLVRDFCERLWTIPFNPRRRFRTRAHCDVGVDLAKVSREITVIGMMVT
jgi:hypothetical protein